ncbi:MAG: hypothetical protein V1851_01155 [Patescibacteria group bacterium]
MNGTTSLGVAELNKTSFSETLSVDLGDKVQLMGLKQAVLFLVDVLRREEPVLKKMPSDWPVQELERLCLSICKKIDGTKVPPVVRR